MFLTLVHISSLPCSQIDNNKTCLYGEFWSKFFQEIADNLKKDFIKYALFKLIFISSAFTVPGGRFFNLKNFYKISHPLQNNPSTLECLVEVGYFVSSECSECSAKFDLFLKFLTSGDLW